jgi:hypothetical protein
MNPAFHRTAIAATAVPSVTQSWNNANKDIREEYGEEYHKVCPYMEIVLPSMFLSSMHRAILCFEHKRGSVNTGLT